MIQYNSQYQTQISEFSNLYCLDLNAENRWIKLAYIIPWDKLVSILTQKYSLTKGTKLTNPRIIIGAIIIKHMLKLSDEETICLISENPYMQFFLGLNQFNPKPIFSPTLFVDIRKKLDKETFDSFNKILISCTLQEEEPEQEAESNQTRQEADSTLIKQETDSTQTTPETDSNQTAQADLGNKGSLKIDATVADQYIRYPNDLSLINEAREKTELIIDLLYEQTRDVQPVKPRTYRKVAHDRYLEQAKKRQKNKKELRKAIRFLLNCVDRNLRHIDDMINLIGSQSFPIHYKYQRELWIIKTLYVQQKHMYDTRTHRCDDRIVSISQPHVRPIVRGKQGKSVEFGSKLGLSVINGFTTTDTLSWDAYNESSDLIGQAEAYRTIMGHYPDLILADKIYWTNKNRKWCNERGIRISASPKGRPKEMTAKEKREQKKEFAQRNHVEGKIGNAKQAFSLNEIKAKIRSTSESWIGATIFTMNVVTYLSQQS